MLLIDKIDSITRKKQHDVFYVQLRLDGKVNNDWERLYAGHPVSEWLDAHEIHWEPCAPFDPESYGSYQGHVFIDVLLDPESSKFKAMLQFFENEDGSSRIPDCQLYLLQLSVAMQYAYQDEPGYWENY